jgi:hypothetical protein
MLSFPEDKEARGFSRDKESVFSKILDLGRYRINDRVFEVAAYGLRLHLYYSKHRAKKNE